MIVEVSLSGVASRPPTGEAGTAERDLVEALRHGDEATFVRLVDSHSAAMVRVARAYVPTHNIAEEVVQDTWLAVLRGLDGFERRSSLRTWLFSILINIAKTRGAHERRTVPFSSAPSEPAGPTVDPRRFLPADDPQWPHHWACPPRRWDLPEPALLLQEVRTRLRVALDSLPPRQRAVISLRDVQGYDTDEVCRLLDIGPGNLRVLLHRGRARMREALEDYLDGERA